METAQSTTTEITLPPRYFVELTTRNRIPVFRYKLFAQMFIQSLQYYIRRGDLKVYGWTILPDRICFIARTDHLSKIIQYLKSYTSEKVIEYLSHYYPHKLSMFGGGRRSIWNTEFSEKPVEDYGSYRRSLKLLHLMPVEENLVQSPLEYEWSSARDRLMDRGLLWLSG